MTIPVIVKPGGVAGNDDVVGLLGHVVLMEVRILRLLPLVPRTVFILILKVRRLLDTQHSHYAPGNPLLLPHPRKWALRVGRE